MNFSAISSSFLGHSSLFTELLLMFWYLPVSLNVNLTVGNFSLFSSDLLAAAFVFLLYTIADFKARVV